MRLIVSSCEKGPKYAVILKQQQMLEGWKCLFYGYVMLKE